MTELAKWVWILILIIFFIGSGMTYFVIANAIVIFLVYVFKPEWFY